MSKPLIIITAADARFFDLAQGCIQSILDKPGSQRIDLAFLDLGCTEPQLAWLRHKVTFIRRPDWEFVFPDRDRHPRYLQGLLARPYLRQYFAGYEVYFWIDADAWVQDWHAVELFVEGARRRNGLAIVPELHRGNRTQYGGLPQWWRRIHDWYAPSFGGEVAKQLCSFPMLNAGVFALAEGAPHWTVWEETLRNSLQKTCTLMTDQIALNYAVYRGGLFQRTEMLPASCNWTCHLSAPCWDEKHDWLTEPYLPNPPLGIVHLSGDKQERARLPTCSGREVEVKLRYPPRLIQLTSTTPSPPAPEFAKEPREGLDRDYISPGLVAVYPDSCFPNMIVGDKSACPWIHLRRGIAHRWYVDRRSATVGFLNRDEAHILYNTALKFRGMPALEIGCWLGWSACHLALAGVQLDIIDPILEVPHFRSSIMESLGAAGVLRSVNLMAGESPAKVHEMAAQTGRRWPFFFIDGNHDAPFPLNDAVACEAYATSDALMLFHDLASPDVAQALDYLRDRGWKTRVYQTMQVMGVAWHGNIEPLSHRPDPTIDWPILPHLSQHMQVSS